MYRPYVTYAKRFNSCWDTQVLRSNPHFQSLQIWDIIQPLEPSGVKTSTKDAIRRTPWISAHP